MALNHAPELTAPEPAVVVPGNHDGVHRGHQFLLERAKTMAAALGIERVVALFFDPHPGQVLRPDAALPTLTPPTRRMTLLEGAGATAAVAHRFDIPFSKLTPEAFVDDVLRAQYGARGIVVGEDFCFGRDRSGDVTHLAALGAARNMRVEAVAKVIVADDIVSSSRIRRCLQEGDVRSAAELLGRYHDIDGTVVHGAQRGRKLGFPTANLEGYAGMLPREGVYAVMVKRLAQTDASWMPGVANVGARPTVDSQRTVEAHIFDFDASIYDEPLRVAFVERVRDVVRFPSLEALTKQIAADAQKAREDLQTQQPEWLAWA